MTYKDSKEPLIAEDVLLLLLGARNATLERIGSTFCAVGGALVAELNLQNRVSIEYGYQSIETHTVFHSLTIHSFDGPVLSDPVLSETFSTISRRTEASVALFVELGAAAYRPLLARLLMRKVAYRRPEKYGPHAGESPIISTHSPYERELVQALQQALESHSAAGPRQAELLSLLAAVRHLTTPALLQSPRALQYTDQLIEGSAAARIVDSTRLPEGGRN